MDPHLYNAAISGDINFLETLTADEETQYFSQLTPMNNSLLHVAAEFKQAKFFVKVYHKCSSLIWQPNSKLETPLHVAARAGCSDIVRFIIQEVSVYTDAEGRRHNLFRKKNRYGDNALHCAVKSARADVVFLLLGKDPELSSFCNYADESPLYLAVSSHSGTQSLIKFIRSSSPSFSHMGPGGLTALHEAVCYDSGSYLVKELLEKRPEMMKEADDILGRTPFHFAAFYGSVEAVKILLKYDVSSSAYLLDHDGNSALHIAAIEGKLNIMKELLQKCPDIFELTNKKCQTALHVAVLNNKSKVVKYVLGNKKLSRLINEPDEDGNTPLHLAVLFDHDIIVELLAMDLRVDIKAKNKEFKSAGDIFSQSFRKDIVRRSGIRTLLSACCLAEYSQHYCRDVGKEWMNRKSELKPLLLGKKEYNEQKKEIYQKFPKTNLIVATLVATISFQAVLTVPGGYPDKGKPIGADYLEFQLFYLFNIISFMSSICSISFQTLATLKGSMHHTDRRYGSLQGVFLFIAVLALGLAFSCGVLIVTLGYLFRPLVYIGLFTLLCWQVFTQFAPSEFLIPKSKRGRRIWR